MHLEEFLSQIIPFFQLGDLRVVMVVIEMNICLSLVFNSLKLNSNGYILRYSV